VLVILGTLYVAWQIHRRASAPASPGLPGWSTTASNWNVSATPCARSGPGISARWCPAWWCSAGAETQLDASAPFARGLVANLAIAAVLLVVVLINLYTASRLQRQIDQLAQQA
jgi:hypothetical protein